MLSRLLSCVVVAALSSSAHGVEIDASLLEPLQLVNAQGAPQAPLPQTELAAATTPNLANGAIKMPGAGGDPLTALDPNGLAGYPVDQTPYDNPGTNTQLIRALPENPQCTVSPQAVFEIQKLRKNSLVYARAMKDEAVLMAKRKAYIEQMTTYINDRIVELNKVKKELKQEVKWSAMTNARIHQFALKEKQLKINDILACVRNEQANLAGKRASSSKNLAQLQRSASAVNSAVTSYSHEMASIESSGNNRDTADTRNLAVSHGTFGGMGGGMEGGM